MRLGLITPQECEFRTVRRKGGQSPVSPEETEFLRPTLWRNGDTGDCPSTIFGIHLGIIDRAISSELRRRADGLIPFAGLEKKERYAEFPGHELVQVVRLLTNPDYRGLHRERQALADTGSQDIQVIGRRTSSIEKPAEATEIQIWRELTAGRDPKM